MKTTPARLPVVFVVEDEADTASATAAYLRLEGFDPVVCGDAQEALAAVATRIPAAVLLDIGLPGHMDGFELAVELRKLLGPGVKLFALTGHAEPAAQLHALHVSIDEFMTKPVNLQQLVLWLRSR